MTHTPRFVRTAGFLVLGAFVAPPAAHAQQPVAPCPGITEVAVVPGSPAALPLGTTVLELATGTGGPLADASGAWSVKALSGDRWTPTAADRQAISRTAGGDPSSVNFVAVRRAGGTTARCRMSVSLPDLTTSDKPTTEGGATTPPVAEAIGQGSATPNPAVATPSPAPSYDACRAAADKASAAVAGDPGRARGKYVSPLTTIVFLDRGASVSESPCFVSVRPPAVGDEILVGVYTRTKSNTPTAWTSITYDPCSLESASPSVLASEQATPSARFGAAPEEWQVSWFPSRRCFDPSVRIAITGAAPGVSSDVTQSFTLKQYARYQATVQAGVISTSLHDRGFGLRPVGSDKLIYEKGPTAKGPEYVATVVLYGIPHYLGSLVGQPRYRGRDVVNDQELLDRVGGVLGVGLSKPSDHFVAGFSFELLAGVNATGTWHWAQVRELAGVKAGDVFAGTADEIPTREVWRREFAGGLSLDLRYATRLFTK